MDTHQTFTFDSCHYDAERGIIELRYTMDDDLRFVETLTLPHERKPVGNPLSHSVDRALQTLHLLGGISYYKTSLPPEIRIRWGTLTVEQGAFFDTVYRQGLGQFFYENKLDPEKRAFFPVTDDPAPVVSTPTPRGGKPRVLVPIGGGKDSMVTIELLKAAGYDCTLLRLGGHPVITSLADAAELPLLTVKRSLSPLLFELNEKGALNGHVPITAYLSSLALLLALLYDFDAVVMSNEGSASEGNLSYRGMEVNHQWSKSLEFERMFQEYARSFITRDVSSFSLLRPFSELAITELFCRSPQYLPLATSCNTNWRILKVRPKEPWCGKCPKCAFVFCMLAAFLPEKKVTATIGKNMAEDAALLPLFRQLLGLEGWKPFECVGTAEETAAALLLAKKHGSFTGTPLLELAERDVFPKIGDPGELIERSLHARGEHAIPASYLHALPKT